MKVELTTLELSIIESALNYYWNDANTNLERKELGDMEKGMYKIQKDLSFKLITKIENL